MSTSAFGQMNRLVRIGTLDGAPEYTFGRIAGMTLLPDGRVLVLDAQAQKVRLYAPDGTHLLSFGRRGQGPGELQLPISPVISDGRILVYDAALRRLVTFSFGGDHIATTAFASDIATLSRLQPLGRGTWIAEDGGVSAQDLGSLVTGRVDPERFGRTPLLLIRGEQADTVGYVRRSGTWWFQTEGGSYGPIRGSPPRGDLWSTAGDSLVVIVDAVEGVVRWLGAGKGGLELMHRRALGLERLPPPRLSRADLIAQVPAEVVGEIEFVLPTFVPHFSQALVASSGAVWLRRYDPRDADSRRYLVVSPDSEDLREITLPTGFSPGIVSGDRVWGVTRDEFDVMYVEAYSLP